MLTQSDLDQFTGDLERYQHWITRIIYTPGVRHLADEGEAYWLIDAIASHLVSRQMAAAAAADARVGEMSFWRLTVSDDRSAVLEARADSGVPPFITQHIPWTDFPLPVVDIWVAWDGERWVLYLPSEH